MVGVLHSSQACHYTNHLIVRNSAPLHLQVLTKSQLDLPPIILSEPAIVVVQVGISHYSLGTNLTATKMDIPSSTDSYIRYSLDYKVQLLNASEFAPMDE